MATHSLVTVTHTQTTHKRSLGSSHTTNQRYWKYLYSIDLQDFLFYMWHGGKRVTFIWFVCYCTMIYRLQEVLNFYRHVRNKLREKIWPILLYYSWNKKIKGHRILRATDLNLHACQITAQIAWQINHVKYRVFVCFHTLHTTGDRIIFLYFFEHLCLNSRCYR